MKLTTTKQKEEQIVVLSLEESGGDILLRAISGNEDKILMEFKSDGEVSRVRFAEIGDFNFDHAGRIIIS